MSTRTIASLYSGVFEGKRLVVEQGDNPAHRTHKSLGLARPPIHVLGPVKRIQFFRQSFNQNVPSASPFPQHSGGEVFALRVSNSLQLSDIYSGFAGGHFFTADFDKEIRHLGKSLSRALWIFGRQ